MTVKTYRVTVPVSILSRNVSRRFEMGEADIPEVELEMIVAHFRRCFTENVPVPAPEAAPDPAPPEEP